MGSGGLIGILVGFAIKRVFKILAVIAGVFFESLMYLQSQNLISVNWETPGNLTVDCNNSSSFNNGRGTYLYYKREFGHTTNMEPWLQGFAFRVMKG